MKQQSSHTHKACWPLISPDWRPGLTGLFLFALQHFETEYLTNTDYKYHRLTRLTFTVWLFNGCFICYPFYWLFHVYVFPWFLTFVLIPLSVFYLLCSFIYLLLSVICICLLTEFVSDYSPASFLFVFFVCEALCNGGSDRLRVIMWEAETSSICGVTTALWMKLKPVNIRRFCFQNDFL